MPADTTSGGNGSLIDMAKQQIWQDAVASAKALSASPETGALYVIFAHTASMVVLDPSVPDATKLSVIQKGAYNFLRGIMSAKQSVDGLTDQQVLDAYIKFLQGE